ATLSAHYQGVPVVHVPVMASSSQHIQDNSLYNVHRFVDYHCVPTQAAAAQLLVQGVHRNAIHVCGSLQADLINTLVNAIQSLQISVSQDIEDICAFARIQHQKIIAVLVDAYEASETLFAMLERVMQQHKDVMITVMISSKQEYSYLFDYEHDRYKVCVAPSYYDRLLLLSKAQIVITNMHDVHEDALCLARPVILLQSYSQYPETVWAGYTHVVNKDIIATQAVLEKLILQHPTYDLKKMLGNGNAAAEIVRFLQPRMV
ncbi:MAG: UDP-N-acetylglucosamine 2-epimerase, partial [Gammaproteobacteria bacterium]|nr:UDP-N-acetylglucosamine 2-epimerase [Gammaproteobacteria bacterium]